MTVWAGGDVVTSAVFNILQGVMDAASYTTNRISLTPNASYNLAGGGGAGSALASNFNLPSSLTFSVATGKSHYTFGLWPSPTITGTAAYRGYSWEATITSNGVSSEALGFVASGTISGDGILKSVYGRAIAAAGFTGTLVGLVGGVTSNATTSVATALQLDAQGSNVSHGIWLTSGTPGCTTGWGMLVDANVLLGNACFANVQATGSTADFLRYVEPTGVTTMWSVDYLGNLNFKASGTALSVGQRITGDFTNATLAKRLMLQTATANSATNVGVLPSGAGTSAGLSLFGLSDPDNASKINIVCASASKATLTVTKTGGGTQNSFGITIGTITPFTLTTTGTLELTPEQVANGEVWTYGALSEEITLSTIGLTTDSSANLLPANAVIEAVTARVTTTITTTTDWKVGDPTTAGRFSPANATLVAGTNSVGLDHWSGAVTTLAAGPSQAATAKVRITCTGANPGAGKIRITVFYRTFTPPQS